MFSVPFLNKMPIPPAAVANRKKTLIAAAAALKAATGAELNARDAYASEEADLAESEHDLQSLEDPGVDLAKISAYRNRRADLALKIDGHRNRVAAAEGRARAASAAVAEAHAAFASAYAEISTPTLKSIDVAAEHSRLKAEANRLRGNADNAKAALARVEREVAAALDAFENMSETGAAENEASDIFDAHEQARGTIAAARSECTACEAAASEIEAQVALLAAEMDRARRARALDAGLRKLESHRSSLVAVKDVYTDTGASLGGLVRTFLAWSELFQRAVDRGGGYHRPVTPTLMLDPKFVEAASVPKLNGEGYFVSKFCRDYAEFELRQDILSPLRESLNRQDADLRALHRQADISFCDEYDRLGRHLLESLAIFIKWRAERDALFAEAGDVAKGVAAPLLPMIVRDMEFQPWRRLHLPALRVGGQPLWHPEWAPERLLELTKSAQAA